MDAVYVVSPFWNAGVRPGSSGARGEHSPYHVSRRATSGMPDPDALLDRYSQVVGFDPRREGAVEGGRGPSDWDVAQIFHNVRGGTISHGIQARAISGQASSDFSHVYFENTARSLDAAWEMVQAFQGRDQRDRSKL